MSDQKTTLDELRAQIQRFVDERNWQQFHAPKSLAMSVSIEAAELMEHFQWLSLEESRQVVSDADRMDQIRDELADVLCYLLALSNVLEIDITSAFNAKMKKNVAKYPVDRFRDRYGYDDPRLDS